MESIARALTSRNPISATLLTDPCVILLVVSSVSVGFAQEAAKKTSKAGTHQAPNSESSSRKVIPSLFPLPQGVKSGSYASYLKDHPSPFKNLWAATEGLASAAQVNSVDPNFLDIDMNRAGPQGGRAADWSYCSSSIHLDLLYQIQAKQLHPSRGEEVLRNPDLNKALTNIGDPKDVIGGKRDGVGIFGHVNANGPGLAVLVHKTKIGRNFWYSPKLLLKKGDYLKVSWNGKVGNEEHGHLVRIEERGTRNGEAGLWVWSSNKENHDGSSGYGKMFIPDSKIKLGIVSRIDNLQNLVNWNHLSESTPPNFATDIANFEEHNKRGRFYKSPLNEKNDFFLYSLSKLRTVDFTNPEDRADFLARTGLPEL